MSEERISRRQACGMISGAVAITAAATIAHAQSKNQDAKPQAAPPARNEICVFTKPFNEWSYDELAERIATLGVDGVEAPIRPRGHIEPERVPDELPKLVEALAKRNLKITVMTTAIRRADEPHAESTLRTAAKLGIRHYRTGYHQYDLTKPIQPQVGEFTRALRDLAALSAEAGIVACYQNHAGPRYFGAPIWDLSWALSDIKSPHMQVAYDIRHAIAEGGLSWPIDFNLIRPHIGVAYFKDFVWDGRKVNNVPLGEGQVDPKFASMLLKTGFTGPISLHEEYLAESVPAEEHLEGIRRDLALLRQWMTG